MKKLIILLFSFSLIFFACNKEKKLMKNLTGNWVIDRSERTLIYPGGSDELIEDIENAGELIIYEDPNNASEETRKFTFMYVSNALDTIQAEGNLLSDEKNKRIIFKNALCDSSSSCDLVWTIDKSKDNKQVWFVYGVDSTFFFPSNNNNNPGNASNWVRWKITLKKQN